MSASELNFVSEFLDLQEETQAELLSKAFFQNISVLSERSKELESEIETIVAGANGLYVLLLTNTGKNDKPNLLGPRLEVELTATIFEDPLVNRSATGTGKQATAVMVEIMRYLHGWKPPIANQMLEFIDFGPIPSDDYLVQFLKFKTKLNIKSAADLTET